MTTLYGKLNNRISVPGDFLSFPHPLKETTVLFLRIETLHRCLHSSSREKLDPSLPFSTSAKTFMYKIMFPWHKTCNILCQIKPGKIGKDRMKKAVVRDSSKLRAEE